MNIMFTRIYALIVCLGAIFCITISSGFGLHAIVVLVHPPLLMSPSEYTYLRSNGEYRSHVAGCRYFAQHTEGGRGYEYFRRCADGAWLQESTVEPLSDEEVESLRAEEMQLKIEDKRHSATSTLVRVGLMLLISIPLFFVHWRIAQKYDRRSGAAT